MYFQLQKVFVAVFVKSIFSYNSCSISLIHYLFFMNAWKVSLHSFGYWIPIIVVLTFYGWLAAHFMLVRSWRAIRLGLIHHVGLKMPVSSQKYNSLCPCLWLIKKVKQVRVWRALRPKISYITLMKRRPWSSNYNIASANLLVVLSIQIDFWLVLRRCETYIVIV